MTTEPIRTNLFHLNDTMNTVIENVKLRIYAFKKFTEKKTSAGRINHENNV